MPTYSYGAYQDFTKLIIYWRALKKSKNQGKRIKISELHEEKTKRAFPKLKTSAKSVQTTAEVCADCSWSLQKVLRTYKFKYVYSRK